MTNLKDNRLIKSFAEMKSHNKKALLPFITAGFPDLDATIALLKEFEARRARICELGIPFSDPVADGPVIQASYTQALADGVTLDKIFQAVRRYRAEGSKLALISMISYSIVFRHGVETFLADAAKAGFDGLIIPDLPLEEAGTVEPLASKVGLCNIMLIAPTSPAARRLEIARHSRGFIYFVSVAGITGERPKLPESTIEAVVQLRKHTNTPVCVGFGVSNAATVSAVCRVANGAIVGSAIVARIAKAAKLPRDQMVKKVGDFVTELLAPIR